VAAEEELDEALMADLVALADGSLPAGRREHVAARVRRSPRLRELLGEQVDALAATRSLDFEAPAGLRELLEPPRS